MAVLGFIGVGSMGGALARAAARKVTGPSLLLANRSPEKAARLAEVLCGQVSYNAVIAAEADFILLGVKPQMLPGVLEGLAPVLQARQSPFVLVSMAAGTSIARVRQLAGGDYPVIRIMPNTPASIGQGMILYSPSENVPEAALAAFLDSMAAALALSDGRHPAQLKDAVCSPGGTTIQGVRALEKNGFRSAVMEAVIAAYEKNFDLK